MSAGGLCYDRYGAGEWMMRIGAAEAPPILFLAPLFEEMNRTRALVAAVMRALAAQGFGCWLPDLPGTGESARALETCTWQEWRSAVAAAARGPGQLPLVASFRGGALLDDAAEGRGWWRFAPVEGASLARDMARAGLVAGGGSAGYPLGESLAEGLRAATLAAVPPTRTLRLSSDPRAADAKLEGPALWRRSEPGTSSELAAALASDLGDWARRCGIC